MKYLLLDIDDTLLDFHKCSKKAMKSAFAFFGYAYHADYFTTFKKINTGYWHCFEQGEIRKEDLLHQRWETFFEAIKLNGNKYDFENKFQEELAGTHEHVEGALELLAYLGSKYEIYTASNGVADSQKKRMKLAGMDSYIKQYFVSEAIGHAKPAKEFFAYCHAYIGKVPKDEIMIIGDSLQADIKGGIDFGIHTCWYNPQHLIKPGQMNIDYIVDRLADVKGFL